MDIDFYKLQISGNDLLLVNQINKNIIDENILPEFSRDICKRNKGVGSNGIIFLYKGLEHEVKLKFYNSRGSSENLSYDALLCAAKYIFDYGISGNEYIVIETDFGVFTIDCIDSTNFRISLGEPGTEKGEVLSANSTSKFNKEAIIQGRSVIFTSVTLKETGISVFFSVKQKNDKKEISNYFKKIKNKKPYRTVFTKIYNEEEISVETYSQYYRRDNCFISAIAGVSSVLNGLCDRELTIYYRSDTLFFQWDKDSNHIYITGQPSYVFSGNYYFDWEN
jgi:diaminopimelate epimerase